MGSVDRTVDTSESKRGADPAYEAVMCWEWEGGALAPTAAPQTGRNGASTTYPNGGSRASVVAANERSKDALSRTVEHRNG